MVRWCVPFLEGERRTAAERALAAPKIELSYRHYNWSVNKK